MNIDISIIVPFLNEEDNIVNLVRTLDSFYAKNKNSVEIIFIDDGSTDSSVQIFKSQSINHFSAKIIQLSQNYGSHSALRAGIKQAKGEYIGFLYADLQDPIELIEKMKNIALTDKKNIIWGARKTTNNGFFETLFSKLYANLMRKYVSPNFPKKGFDVVLFDKKVQKQLNNNIENNSSIFLQILTLGFRQGTVEYDKIDRKEGQSKWTFSKKVKLFVDSFVAFSYFPIKVVSVSGIALFIIGVVWSGYLIGRTLLVNDLESGWPALISILLIGFGITNIGLGIVAEYLWRTLDISRNRPVFIIDEIIELNN